MAVPPDIRDHAYKLFTEEAPDLLQAIESDLLTLGQDRSPAKIYSLMRNAHSIKGGAASVELDEIATLAHRLETLFKALYSESLEVNADLESQLLQAYDCLRVPLMHQVTTGTFDSEQSLRSAEVIFTQIEAELGDILLQVEHLDIPTSAQMGVDMTLTILEVDVAEQLERLSTAIATSTVEQVEQELRSQIEVYTELSEILNKPGLGTIAAAIRSAIANPAAPILQIAEAALINLQTYRKTLLSSAGKQEIQPSEALLSFQSEPFNALAADALPAEFVISTVIEAEVTVEVNEAAHENWMFGLGLDPSQTDLTFSNLIEALEEAQIEVEAPGSDVELDLESTPRLFSPATGTSAAESPFPLFEQTTQPISAQIHSEDISVSPITTTTRVNSERLEQMNNLVDESIIQRSGAALNSDRIQKSIREVLNQFTTIDQMMVQLRKVADRTLISPGQQHYGSVADVPADIQETAVQSLQSRTSLSRFDSLEMDQYGTLHWLLQRFQEEMIQLREQVDDIDLFTRRSNKSLASLQKTLSHLQDDFTSARMLPIGEVLNRFSRLLRDLSNLYQKPVELRLRGTEVLVDKAVLERIADPLVHLIRNAFDHGIESPEVRRQQGKSKQGLIEIRVFHQGRQTIIEVKDDGAGLNLERIAHRAVASGLLSPQDIYSIPSEQLFNLIFEPGFSTASQLSELSGRGVGLDVVRTQLRALKGTISVISQLGKGTAFTLCLPSTLTSDTLLVCAAGVTTLAFSLDSFEEVFVPRADQVIRMGEQWFLQWRREVLPIYRLVDILAYEGPTPNMLSASPLADQGKALGLQKLQADQSANPLLIIAWRQKFAALEVDQLITEQKLIIKSFGAMIAPPPCIYGCTILSDGQIVPVVDGAGLIEEALERISRRKALPAVSLPTGRNRLHENQTDEAVAPSFPPGETGFARLQATAIPKILVVDDAVSLRQTLSLTLESAGYRVLQAGDGWEAIQQLQQHLDTALVISDIEMPNMNGFDFMHYRRQNPALEKIPLVILSSRSNDKHKRLATHLGATAYFTEPYIEQAFLQSIQTIVKSALAEKDEQEN